MIFMMTPKSQRFFRILSKFFLFAMLILSSCSVDQEKLVPFPQIEIANEDRVWLEKFFQDFFLDGPTIYTLFGSKPMSEISLCTASKEEWIEGYSSLWKNLSEAKQKEFFTELEDHIKKYDLHINWEKWMDWRKKYPSNSFLFAKRKTEYEKLFSVYILNVQEAAWTLQKHYSIIKKELGEDFDPIQVVFEFEDHSSIFWEKIFSSHLLQGILHGFGERNAYFFDREMQLQEINEFDLRTHPLFTSTTLKQGQEGGSINTIPLPMFRSYSSDVQEDPVFLQYQKEREGIKKILKGKNLSDAILCQLGYQSTASKKEIAFH